MNDWTAVFIPLAAGSLVASICLAIALEHAEPSIRAWIRRRRAR